MIFRIFYCRARIEWSAKHDAILIKWVFYIWIEDCLKTIVAVSDLNPCHSICIGSHPSK